MESTTRNRMDEAHPYDTIDVTSIDWWDVTMLSPSTVGTWVLYLHQKECPAANDLLDFISPTGEITLLADMTSFTGTRHIEWEALAESDLPCILMDIVSELDMFSDRQGAFKSISYSSRILDLLSHFLITLRNWPDADMAKVTHVIRGLVGRMDRFCKAMWTNRHLIHTTSPSCAKSSAMFTKGCHIAIAVLVQWHMTELNQAAPLSTLAAHFSLYQWIYDAGEHFSKMPIPSHINQMLAASEAAKVHALFREVVDGDPSRHLPDMLTKIDGFLRDDQVSADEARTIGYICFNMLFYNKDRLSAIACGTSQMPLRLIPSLFQRCHMFICGSPTEKGSETVQMLLQTMV
ncbi:hypothetical protein EUX98_g3730 [Antrodiella citrinella]|uniref:Uncharacterized protein n=1 Tax=Antrodiella citrinella TaxID=2447956 RepID=A0A4S4MVT2_9APHY|nr:hypothetical protein EUX98_g3730 [Antrodiella citrinella]